MALIPDDIIAQVIDRTDIVETIATYIPLKRAGSNFKANCPFHHEKTPSFVINPDKQIFHCFGCGVGGNVISFIMKHDHLEFPEAVRMLAEKVNVDVPSYSREDRKTTNRRQLIFDINQLAVDFFHNYLLCDKSESSNKAREYLKQRDISLDTVKQFQLGLAPDKWDGLMGYLRDKGINLSLMETAGLIIAREKKDGFYDRFRNRIMFPIFDSRKQCRAFGARALDDSPAKYINSPETELYVKGQHLYGFHLAKTAIVDEDCIVIVEGYTDCIIPYQAGFKNIVASLGTALTVDQIRFLRRYTKNVVMLFDADQAGASAVMRSLDLLIEEGISVKVATLKQGEDPDSFIRSYGVDEFRRHINEAKTFFDYKLGKLKARYDINSIENRAKISEKMLSTIAKFNNEIIRMGYIDRLAQELLINKQALLSELNKTSKNLNQRQTSSAQPVPVQSVKLNVVESSILKLLLDEKKLIAVTKEELEITDFKDDRVRNVMAAIYEMFEQGKDINCSNLLNHFDDHAMRQMITGLASDEDLAVVDKDKMHRDCINKIKNERNRMERQKLLYQIKEAESSGNHLMLDQLKEQFNQLIRK